ncbi:MAG: hypothetical protein A2Z38_00150 [Planctomycetes bacterium RBG_19FT_COMBO_48_8]|nr:MAG: hypothetical protein A2Z38_00150 [Planctomycetes bacterium RBG_19FT_COMBO_48_8]
MKSHKKFVLYYYIVIIRYILLIVRKKIKEFQTIFQTELTREVRVSSMSFEFIDLTESFQKMIIKKFTAIFIDHLRG